MPPVATTLAQTSSPARIPLLLVLPAIMADEDTQQLISQEWRARFPSLPATTSDWQWFNSLEEPLTIETTRQLISQFAYAATDRLQLVVLLHGETLSPLIQNTLLKSLEEPPAGCQLVIVTSQTSTLLPTLLSRCQVFWLTVPAGNSALAGNEEATPVDPSQLYQSMRAGTAASAIELADQYKDRATALAAIIQLVTWLYQECQRQPSAPRVKHLQALETARQQLQENVNPKLVIEACCFALQSAV